jgi:hypothetical protein
MALPLASQDRSLERQAGARHTAPVRSAETRSPAVRIAFAADDADALAVRLERLLKRRLADLSDRRVGSAVELIGANGGLFPGEAELVVNAGAKRVDEFSAGRCCARRALAALGRQPVALPMGRWHEPVWPLGFAGSITHDGRFAAALAYPSAGGRARISLDLVDFTEPAAFAEIADAIRHPAEPAPSDARSIARLFSAKEAAIKIVSPAIADFIDFQDIRAAETGFGFRVEAERAGIAADVHMFELGDLIVSIGMR